MSVQGLPAEWKLVLKASAISRDEVKAHPQEVLDVLQFHMNGPPPKLPRQASLKRACEDGTGLAARGAAFVHVA